MALPKNIDDSFEVGGEDAGFQKAILRKHSVGTYTLTIGNRKRWGNAVEISEDVSYLTSFGCLPPAVGGAL